MQSSRLCLSTLIFYQNYRTIFDFLPGSVRKKICIFQKLLGIVVTNVIFSIHIHVRKLTVNEDKMAGLELCEPTELYNLLNQATVYPCLSDPNYLLLLGKLTVAGLFVPLHVYIFDCWSSGPTLDYNLTIHCYSANYVNRSSVTLPCSLQQDQQSSACIVNRALKFCHL